MTKSSSNLHKQTKRWGGVRDSHYRKTPGYLASVVAGSSVDKVIRNLPTYIHSPHFHPCWFYSNVKALHCVSKWPSTAPGWNSSGLVTLGKKKHLFPKWIIKSPIPELSTWILPTPGVDRTGVTHTHTEGGGRVNSWEENPDALIQRRQPKRWKGKNRKCLLQQHQIIFKTGNNLKSPSIGESNNVMCMHTME